jgi:uncharacterized protein (DUF1697 family)
MQKYVAFISGLPFGGGDAEVQKIRALFERLGFSNVETFHGRDTVIFDTAPVGVIGPLEAQISRHLKRSLDLDYVWTFIRTPAELSDVVKSAPFATQEDDHDPSFLVLLSEEPDDRTARALRIRRSDSDELIPAGKHVYWLRHESAETGPPPSLREIIDAPATVRSLRTISRLAEQYSPRAAKRSGKPAAGDATQSERSRR